MVSSHMGPPILYATPHMKPFYCSIFWDMGHYYTLESYKDPISNKYKNEWSVLILGHPILYTHLIWNHITAAFCKNDIIRFRRSYKDTNF